MDAEPLEIERKFLIRRPDEALLEKVSTKRIEITQTYLLSGAGGNRRVRHSRTAEGERWHYTEKQRLTDVTRIEREREIGEAEYKRLLQEADPDRSTICKTRWCVPFGGHTLEIDLFPFWSDRAFCEAELCDEGEELLLPEWLEVLREVTSDRRYSNYALARRLPEDGD